MIASTQYGPVTVLTIDRPERRNALTIELCHGLRSGVRDAVDGGARVLVLTGAGTSFCSGADLDAVYSEAFRAALYELLHTVAGAPIPVLAAVNGPAIGAGTQLAIAADLRVAAPTARFGPHGQARAGRRPVDDPPPGPARRAWHRAAAAARL